MPNQSDVGRRQPALDGLRAVAVALVVAYHGGVPGPRVAGFYGVDIFFVLSGFLITRLLLGEHEKSGRIRFAEFWGRRARRLLPGLAVVLLAVWVYVSCVASPGLYPGLRGDILSVISYVSNWHFIRASSDYFNASAAPSLLTHTWSLAIEEQFYVLWPLLIWAAVRVARHVDRRPASLVLAMSCTGALSSAGWMAFLYRSGATPSRLYYGTDTHAQSILAGCALAAATALLPAGIRFGRAAGATALLCTGGLAWASCSLGSSDPLTYEGGFLAVALLTAALIAVVDADHGTVAARVLSEPALVYIGRISYGMYLWYFPLFAAIDRANTGLAGVSLFLARCAADVVAAALSFHLIEQPVRRWRPRERRALPSIVATLAIAGTLAVSLGAFVIFGTSTVTTTDAAASPVDSGSANAHASSVPGSEAGAGPRLLVFGDSTAATLGDALSFSSLAEQRRVTLDVVGVFGCGLVTSAAVDVHGQATIPPPACRYGAAPRESWTGALNAAIKSFHPAFVLIAAGRWEVAARRATPGAPWVDITQPSDAVYVRSQLETAASVVTTSGAHLAIATAPCFASGEEPDGGTWPEDSPARLDAYNTIVRQVVSTVNGAHAGRATVVDLDSMVCPGSKFRTIMDGVKVRAPDGIHYPFFDVTRPADPAPDTLASVRSFGTWMAPRILKALGIHAGLG